jgi:hypothetical protein
MQKTSSSDRGKKTRTNSRSCMDPTIDCRMREVRGTLQSAWTEILPH